MPADQLPKDATMRTVALTWLLATMMMLGASVRGQELPLSMTTPSIATRSSRPILAPDGANETYLLRVDAYCAPGTLCGFASHVQLERHVCQAAEELNIEYRPTGISYQPLFTLHEDDDGFLSLCDRRCLGRCLGGAQADTSCLQDGDCAGGTCDRDASDYLAVCTEEAECSEGVCEKPRSYWQRSVAAKNAGAINLWSPQCGSTCSNFIPDQIDPNPPPPGSPIIGGDETIKCHIVWPAARWGSVWAHEMGHLWCLRHTFAGADEFTACPSCDDTPPDPNSCEYENSTVSCCDHDTQAADTGSPHSSYCSTECYDSNGDQSTHAPLTNLAMSYYPFECKGPYVQNGVPHDAFTLGQMDVIELCKADYQRTLLVDVCAENGGDADSDGICGDADNCPTALNTCQSDADGDGIGDVCDLCPFDAAPTGDIDEDGQGDICDADRDGDGCSNVSDQHPDEANILVGERIVIDVCGPNSSSFPYHVFEGSDSDADGTANCADPDDDNDGLCDSPGVSVPSGVPGAAEGCSGGGDPCVVGEPADCTRREFFSECPEWWRLCGLECVELELWITRIVNPAVRVVFRRFAVVNETLFVLPSPGTSASDALESFAPVAAPGARGIAGSNDDRIRVEIRRRGDQTLAAVVAEYAAGDVEVETGNGGRIVAVTVAQEGSAARRIVLSTVDSIGAPSGWAAPDGDGDGVGDFADNCVERANTSQADGNKDGYGDACDADLNDDEAVTMADRQIMVQCEGIAAEEDEPGLDALCTGDCDFNEAVTVEEVVSGVGIALGEATVERCEAIDVDGSGTVAIGEIVRAVSRVLRGCDADLFPAEEPIHRDFNVAPLCIGADITGDGAINSLDRALVNQSIGSRPGPSAYRVLRNLAGE